MEPLQSTEDIKDVLKEGWMTKQSRILKKWRKYPKFHYFPTYLIFNRRWFVLTPVYLYSFREEKNYQNPTEIIYLKECTAVSSAEEEIYKEHSIVKNYILVCLMCNKISFRSWIQRLEAFISWLLLPERKNLGSNQSVKRS